MILNESDVHVWKIDLKGFESRLDEMTTCLSINDQARLQTIRHFSSRKTFIVSRVAIRHILSKYLGEDDRFIELSLGVNGKPFLSQTGDNRVEFNLSHSGNMAVLVINLNAPVGIDIEQLRPIRQLEQLVIRFLSPEEVLEVLGVEEKARTKFFFDLWTAKESFSKATGIGISGLLNKPMKQLLDDEGGNWQIVPLELESGYIASLCVHKAKMSISYFAWKDDV